MIYFIFDKGGGEGGREAAVTDDTASFFLIDSVMTIRSRILSVRVIILSFFLFSLFRVSRG